MTDLDFEGEYGAEYARTIRRSIPGYDTLHEIATAALRATAARAQAAMVVGPGAGEELPELFAALPAASFTLVEPSEQMRHFCAAMIQREGEGGRCEWLIEPVEQCSQLHGRRFDAVIAHHVIHLLPPSRQTPWLRRLAALVAPGGCLVLSSYSEASDPDLRDLVLSVGRARLLGMGMTEEEVRLQMATGNSVVHSLEGGRLAQALCAEGLEPPVPLCQALFSRLWISRRRRAG